MPFEINGTLKKWHMTNTLPEIDKCCFHKKMAPYKNGTTKNGTLRKWHTLQKDD